MTERLQLAMNKRSTAIKEQFEESMSEVNSFLVLNGLLGVKTGR